jgi:hypothetical protein
VQNSSLSHASTLQTRPKNSHSVYIDGRDTNLFFELLSLICVTRARVFIFIAFTKAATRENLVRWRTDLHHYQEQNRLLRVVPRKETRRGILEPLNTYIKSIPQGYIFLSCSSFPAIER